MRCARLAQPQVGDDDGADEQAEPVEPDLEGGTDAGQGM
jgi:hypothetical protein